MCMYLYIVLFILNDDNLAIVRKYTDLHRNALFRIKHKDNTIFCTMMHLLGRYFEYQGFVLLQFKWGHI